MKISVYELKQLINIINASYIEHDDNVEYLLNRIDNSLESVDRTLVDIMNITEDINDNQMETIISLQNKNF